MINKDNITPINLSLIGKRVRELRKSRGISQADLAMAAGVTTKTIYNIESADRGTFSTMPRIDTIYALASILDTSIDYLVTGIGPMNEDIRNYTDLFKHLDPLILQGILIPNITNDNQLHLIWKIDTHYVADYYKTFLRMHEGSIVGSRAILLKRQREIYNVFNFPIFPEHDWTHINSPSNTIIPIDKDIEYIAITILNKKGLDLTKAINLFLRLVVYKGRIPFDVSEVPNKETLEAIQESRALEKGTAKGKTLEELRKELGL
ncbi:MAG: helix-turn-helix domain-containing protein [Bacilli bacterium]|jgi:addiction module RelB/DinJ family antitoxin|nr:helix-turn-helix domain-containing protein [Bacilli bacterium]MDD3422159.1 helix-turn-helix domain-containing protein [Bacilli bacterium]MDD4065453.1 helix-turn-helix domain-containing protein [Bacilli bacterium]